MTKSSSLRSFAEFLEALEADDIEVVSITGANGALFEGDTLMAELQLSIPLLESRSIPEQLTIEFPDGEYENGRLSVEVHVHVSASDSGVNSDNANEGPAIERDPSNRESSETSPDDDESPSPYTDEERLRNVYEEHDTFAEMRDALGVEVTPQTVRRKMIDFGIHVPNSPDNHTESGQNGSEAEPKSSADRSQDGQSEDTVVADGLDLPSDITIEELQEVVREANTIHEAQARLGIDREDVRRILTDLNLLDLVTGRLVNADDPITNDEIDERIRTAMPRTSES